MLVDVVLGVGGGDARVVEGWGGGGGGQLIGNEAPVYGSTNNNKAQTRTAGPSTHVSALFLPVH